MYHCDPSHPVPIMGNMNLSFLDDLPKAPGPEYREAKIEYIGGLGYTLNTFEAYIRFVCQDGGFRIVLREPLFVMAEALLGNTVSWGWLTDVKIHSGGHTWSMARLFPGNFPKKIRAGEVFSVNNTG
jgi:hypothetical protein